MENGRAPVFRELARAEIESILARNHVGRVAYSFHDRVDIEPIHHVYDAGWIYGHTAPVGRAASTSHVGDFAARSSLAASASFADHDLERYG